MNKDEMRENIRVNLIRLRKKKGISQVDVAIQKELESVESQIERLMKLYAVGRYDMDTLDRMVMPLEEKKYPSTVN